MNIAGDGKVIMRVNVLQHTPNEGPGAIAAWAAMRGHDLFVYHPYTLAQALPEADETDFLIVLGGPMGPNDQLDWIEAERDLIKTLLSERKPIFGACFGAQQIAKTLGAAIVKAPHKEVGWANISLQTNVLPNLPDHILALHWHEEMFEIPEAATLLFSSQLVENQGFIYRDNVIGLQCHLEPEQHNVNEMVMNDYPYALENNALNQAGQAILAQPVPPENKKIMFDLLDYMVQPESAPI